MATVAEQLASARHAAQSGRREEAWVILAPLARQFPDEAVLQFEAGRAALAAGHIDDAVRLLAALTAAKPEIGAAWGVLGEAYAASGWARDAAEALTKAASLQAMPPAVHARIAGLRLLTEGADAARPALETAVRMLKADLAAGRYDNALETEERLIQSYGRVVESEDHIESTLALWRDDMTAAGRRAAKALPVPMRPAKPDGAPVVGFFLHSASMLGHVELTLDYMSAMAKDGSMPLRPRLYVFTGASAALEGAARERDLPVTFVERDWGSQGFKPYQRLLWLRERLARDSVDALVWVSLQSLAHFGAALGLAPVNVFWALRFRGIDSPDIQGRVACASCFETEDVVHGQRWDVVPLAFRDLRGPARVAEAAALRKGFGDPALVFGTFARREKMQGDAWLEAVGRSLKACPEAVFVWAGRQEDPKVAGALADMGVASQSRFVGWVDTRLYAQAIDVFLDCAPVGCGMTAMEAMAWGKPLVSFKDPLTNWGQCLAPLLDGRVQDPTAKADIERIFALGSGRELLAWSDSPAGYADWVRRLAEDKVLRADVGAAARAFTDKYFGDSRYAAGRFAELLRALIASAA